MCLSRGDTERAVEYFQQAVEISPNPVPARLRLAEVYEAHGQGTKAATTYEEVLTLDPEQPLALNNLAYYYVEQDEKLDRALELAEKLAEAELNDPFVLDTMGWVYHRAGRHEEAIQYLQEASRSRTETGMIAYHLGEALRAANRRQDAEDAFQKALTLPLPPDVEQKVRTALQGLRQ